MGDDEQIENKTKHWMLGLALVLIAVLMAFLLRRMRW